MAVSKRGYVCIWMGKDIGQTRDRGNGICSICYPPNSKTSTFLPFVVFLLSIKAANTWHY